ncbi:MAG: IPT/TIG domain-containing protein [Dysgonamonadaceae bacterium]|nr:IPT/TIG domain-containing protein [Dysgonamonadaceae bacterium]
MIFLCVVVIVAVSCNKNDATWLVETTDSPIVVEKVVDPTSYDTPVTGASLEQLIKVIGTNLANTASVYINDVEAEMPLYANVVNGILYIRVPYIAPTIVDNKIKITDKNGNTTEIPNFVITLPHMQGNGPTGQMEWVEPGKELTISGDYFDLYRMDETTGGVVKIGNQNAQIVSMSKTEIKIIVPASATPNSDITLISPTGETVICKNRYRDGRWLMTDFNDKAGNGSLVYSNWIYQSSALANGDPEPVDGTYLLYSGVYPGGYSAQGWGVLDMFGLSTIPDNINTERDQYYFKFEAWTEFPPIMFCRFEFESWDPNETRTWWHYDNSGNIPVTAPVLGQWYTVSIPAEMITSNVGGIGVIKCFRIVDQGSTAGAVHAAIDNPRFSLK